MRQLRLLGRDRGSMAVEFVIAAPILVVLLLVVSAGGEWLNISGNVGAAARDSVRAASLARSYPEAETAAQQAALTDLKGVCAGADLDVPPPTLYIGGAPTGDFAAAQDIGVTVRCSASLSVYRDVGFPVRHTFTETAVAPLDPFEDRG
jgi:Flp pilus assembly protein TadG